NPVARLQTKSANPSSRSTVKPRPPRTPCMLNSELLAILCCPETHQPLAVAPADFIASLNERIKSAVLKNRAGEVIPEPIDGALIREDQKFAYLIRKDIPVLLIDQAVALA